MNPNFQFQAKNISVIQELFLGLPEVPWHEVFNHSETLVGRVYPRVPHLPYLESGSRVGGHPVKLGPPSSLKNRFQN